MAKRVFSAWKWLLLLEKCARLVNVLCHCTLKVLLVHLRLLPSCGLSMCVCNIPFLSSAGLVARLHLDDPVPTGGLLHPGGFHPDDCVGQGQAPQLPEGVPRLPSSPLTHPALRPVEDRWAAPRSATPLVGVMFPLAHLSPSHPFPSFKIYTGT